MGNGGPQTRMKADQWKTVESENGCDRADGREWCPDMAETSKRWWCLNMTVSRPVVDDGV